MNFWLSNHCVVGMTVVIKPADKGGAVVVWRADLYTQALRQLKDASFYTKLNSDPTLSHQKTVKTTILIVVLTTWLKPLNG